MERSYVLKLILFGVKIWDVLRDCQFLRQERVNLVMDITVQQGSDKFRLLNLSLC